MLLEIQKILKAPQFNKKKCVYQKNPELFGYKTVDVIC